ncbi:MAG: Gfo/Idh/MocA family oxidoreductase, partial [Oscillospiraceae bacterium]|nr:Gfo/Idh/MocA family oxidoreductase [Oscillospiraceae bacterium]
DKLRVGVIGTGYVAKNNFLPVLAQTEDIEFVGVMAKNYENALRAAKSYGAEQAVDSIEKLVDLGLDCAFVLTPKAVHADQISFLLNHGVDTYSEKPMATTLRDCAMVADLAEKTGRKLMIGFNRRYAPVVKTAKEAWADGMPDVIIAQKNRPQTEYHATLENAVHMIDLMRYFCGEAADVKAISKYVDRDYETFTTAQIQFESGSAGLLVADRSAGQWEESLEMHGGNRTVLIHMPESVTIVDNEQRHTTEMTPLAMGWAKSEDKLGFSYAIRHFFDCIRNNTMPLTSPQDAYKTHELLNRVLLSAGLPGME